MEANEPESIPFALEIVGMPSEFEGLACQVVQGCRKAASEMLKRPGDLIRAIEGLKSDRLAPREPGLKMEEPRECFGEEADFWALALASSRDRAKLAGDEFLAGGLASCEADLIARYKRLESKDGRLDFKADVLAIERAVLAGSPEALRETVERSPMALWAMDFSLSEYEAENILAFCAKYAPAGPDLEMIDFLLSMGARLPVRRMELSIGWGMAQAEGVEFKAVESCAAAFSRAGYCFEFADGLLLLQSPRFDREQVPGAPSAARQKIMWLDWIEENGHADWREGLDRERAMEQLALLPGGTAALDSNRRRAEFVEFAKLKGRAGLGAWVGLAQGPLGAAEAWAEMGAWLCGRGLAREAFEAAEGSGSTQAQALLLPWAERQGLGEALDAGRGEEAACSRAGALRI